MKKFIFIKKFTIIVAILLIIVLIMYYYFDRNIKEVVFNMARAQVTAFTTKSFNEAVSEIFQEDIDHSELIEIILDNDGKVTMIKANTVEMNRLATRTAILAQSKISEIEESGIKIPMGSLFKGQLLSGRGPKIIIKIIPIGSVNTQFVTEFEQAGINQTRHKIFLLASIKVNIVIPTGTKAVEVKSYVPISECIIIGEVPDSYAVVIDENMLNLLPR